MSGISSVGSTSSSTYYSPLDTNQDGIVDAAELAAAAKSGQVSASASADQDSSDPSATDKFSDSLTNMLLQQMQQSGTTADTVSSDADSSSTDNSSVESVFHKLDTNGDGKVSADEFVAGRPKDMSATDAQTLFKTIDTENTGMLNEGQFSQGVDILNGLAGASASSSQTASASSSDPLEAFLTEMEASMTAYQNTYGQYDLGTTTATDSAAV